MEGLEGTKTDRQALTGNIAVKHGVDGESVTITDITESAEDGGTNTVKFSDGSTLKIKNGSSGKNGKDGANGADGKDGNDGKSAYQYAQDGGYTGTEEEFALLMSQENLQTEKVDKISIEVSKLSEEMNDLKENGTGGTGLSTVAISLLMTVLKSGIYETNQSTNINALEKELTGSEDTETEQPENGIVQTGSILAITSGVTATQTGSVLEIA